ncbi:MAG: 4Fe-4S cluster-binding domain-containing protein [Mycoplasmoidaceae bacterium]|nr:4Fe-4S cluster-binding domain-containing protein [Mycoplasmoidaceae bacterium]
MENNKIRLAGIAPQSLVNGKGMRKVYFSQGCTHACKNCFNQET